MNKMYSLLFAMLLGSLAIHATDDDRTVALTSDEEDEGARKLVPAIAPGADVPAAVYDEWPNEDGEEDLPVATAVPAAVYDEWPNEDGEEDLPVAAAVPAKRRREADDLGVWFLGGHSPSAAAAPKSAWAGRKRRVGSSSAAASAVIDLVSSDEEEDGEAVAGAGAGVPAAASAVEVELRGDLTSLKRPTQDIFCEVYGFDEFPETTLKLSEALLKGNNASNTLDKALENLGAFSKKLNDYINGFFDISKNQKCPECGSATKLRGEGEGEGEGEGKEVFCVATKHFRLLKGKSDKRWLLGTEFRSIVAAFPIIEGVNQNEIANAIGRDSKYFALRMLKRFPATIKTVRDGVSGYVDEYGRFKDLAFNDAAIAAQAGATSLLSPAAAVVAPVAAAAPASLVQRKAARKKTDEPAAEATAVAASTRISSRERREILAALLPDALG